MHKHFRLLIDKRFANPIACADGMEFVTQFVSLKEAWFEFARPDWMCWLLEKTGYNNQRKLTLIAVRCVRETMIDGSKTVFDILPEDAKAPFLITERYAMGEDISIAERRSAYRAASEAASWAASRASSRAAYRAASWAKHCQIIREVVLWPELNRLITKKCKEFGIV